LGKRVMGGIEAVGRAGEEPLEQPLYTKDVPGPAGVAARALEALFVKVPQAGLAAANEAVAQGLRAAGFKEGQNFKPTGISYIDRSLSNFFDPREARRDLPGLEDVAVAPVPEPGFARAASGAGNEIFQRADRETTIAADKVRDRRQASVDEFKRFAADKAGDAKEAAKFAKIRQEHAMEKTAARERTAKTLAAAREQTTPRSWTQEELPTDIGIRVAARNIQLGRPPEGPYSPEDLADAGVDVNRLQGTLAAKSPVTHRETVKSAIERQRPRAAPLEAYSPPPPPPPPGFKLDRLVGQGSGVPPVTGYGARNKLVSSKAADAARAALKSSGRSLSDLLKDKSGAVDPEIFRHLVTLGTYHFEAGAREFGRWAGQMTRELGDPVKPHLKAIWSAVQTQKNKIGDERAPAKITGPQDVAANNAAIRSDTAVAPEQKPNAPGPMLDPPMSADETTRDFAKRIDDGLYRVRKNGTADKIEAKHFIESFPKAVTSTDALQGKVYREVEHRLIDPKATYSPKVKAFLDNPQVKRWRARETALAAKLVKRLGRNDADIPLIGEGYVHRVAEGKGHYLDRADPETGRQADPIMGQGRSLSKFASSMQARKFYVLEGPDGRRVFQKATPSDLNPKRGSDGKMYTPKLATTQEIEANTATRYHKNFLINTVDNVLRLERIDRNLDLADEIKATALDRDEYFPLNSQREVPRDYIKIDMPGVEGFWAPRLGHVLQDFQDKVQGDPLGMLTSINRFLTAALFWTPLPHIRNVAQHWIVGRGWDWINPVAYRRLMQTSTAAMKAVMTQDENYVRMLREGSGLMYGDVANQNFYKLMIEKMGNEQIRDPQTWGGIAKTFGFQSVKDMVRWEYRASSKMLWAVNDMFLLQRQMELMQKGMGPRKAIAAAEKDIPNYRIPSTVLGSRGIANLLKSPNYLMFGRYKFGQFNAIYSAFRDLIRGTNEERKEAAGKLLVMGGMMFGVYAFANAALRQITGNPQDRISLGGPFSILQSGYEMMTGERDWMSALSSMLTLAPSTEIAKEVTTDRDVYGRPIVNSQSGLLAKGVQAGEAALGHLGPGAIAEEAMKPRGVTRAVGQQFGITLAAPDARHGKNIGKKIERRQAAKRGVKDPLQRLLDVR
jgi:hypothetical protein